MKTAAIIYSGEILIPPPGTAFSEVYVKPGGEDCMLQ
jgi:hypothetical protein